MASRVAAYFTPERLAAYPNVDGVLALTHHTGCSIPLHGLAYEYLQRSLRNVARNPNIAAFVVIGLGCEVNQIEPCFEVTAERMSGLNPAGPPFKGLPSIRISSVAKRSAGVLSRNAAWR